MDSILLYSQFDEASFNSDNAGWHPDSRPKAHREVHGIELSAVLSENMLVKQIHTARREVDRNAVEDVSVYLCYNWRSKTEFILVRFDLTTTSKYYTPQYGRDDNYSTSTRHNYKFLAYSVEAFKEHQSELAEHLNRV